MWILRAHSRPWIDADLASSFTPEETFRQSLPGAALHTNHPRANFCEYRRIWNISMSVDRYEITKEDVLARPIAAVRARASLADLRRQIPALVDKVYDAAADGDLRLDGQNVVVYRGVGPELDIDVGVGALGPFAPKGSVTYSETPAGTVARTTHWGDYAELPQAHAAVTRWCNAHECALAGPRWEVYGQWDDNPLRRRTDVYYLLK